MNLQEVVRYRVDHLETYVLDTAERYELCKALLFAARSADALIETLNWAEDLGIPHVLSIILSLHSDAYDSRYRVGTQVMVLDRCTKKWSFHKDDLFDRIPMAAISGRLSSTQRYFGLQERFFDALGDLGYRLGMRWGLELDRTS